MAFAGRGTARAPAVTLAVVVGLPRTSRPGVATGPGATRHDPPPPRVAPPRPPRPSQGDHRRELAPRRHGQAKRDPSAASAFQPTHPKGSGRTTWAVDHGVPLRTGSWMTRATRHGKEATMPTTVHRAKVLAGNKKFMAAFGQKNAGALAKLYTKGGQLLPPGSEVVSGGAAIQAFWQGALDAGLVQATLDTVEVEGYRDTAIEVGRYTLRRADGQVADAGSTSSSGSSKGAPGNSTGTSGIRAVPPRGPGPSTWRA